MPRYRLIFQDPEGFALDLQGGIEGTKHIDSGDEVYEVGALIEHDGKRWRVSQAPVKQPAMGEIADLMLWPAD